MFGRAIRGRAANMRRTEDKAERDVLSRLIDCLYDTGRKAH